VFGAGHPPAQQSITTAHSQPPTPLPSPPAEPPPAASLYSVTVWAPNRDVANYKIKWHARMGEVCEYHANRWLTDPGSLRFLIDGEQLDGNQTPSTLSLQGITDSQNVRVDCCLSQGGPNMAHRQRRLGPLPSHTKQPQRPPPPPEPPPRRASSSSDYHSYGNGSDGRFSEWSSSWSNEDSHYSGGPRSDGSWEDGSFCDSYTHSHGNCDSDCDSTSTKQGLREYMDYDPCWTLGEGEGGVCECYWTSE